MRRVLMPSERDGWARERMAKNKRGRDGGNEEGVRVGYAPLDTRRI